MSGQILDREMTDKEQQFLADLLQRSPSNVKRWMEGAQNALVLWAAGLLGLVLLWLLLAWLIKLIVHVDFGLKSQYAIWIVSFFAAICGTYAIYSSVKWVKGWPDPRPALRLDIDERKVIDERYRVTAAKRFQEPEHGGLIYFLRMDDDRVLVLYDYESVEREMDGKDALSSTFKPRSELHIVRAPNTKYFIEQEFSGEALPLSEPLELAVPPDQWPE
jgi:hypothetical protein